jgi:hypothetical protein
MQNTDHMLETQWLYCVLVLVSQWLEHTSFATKWLNCSYRAPSNVILTWAIKMSPRASMIFPSTYWKTRSRDNFHILEVVEPFCLPGSLHDFVGQTWNFPELFIGVRKTYFCAIEPLYRLGILYCYSQHLLTLLIDPFPYLRVRLHSG